MSLTSFIEHAGEKLLTASTPLMPANPNTAIPDMAQLNATAGAAIAKYVASQHLSAQILHVMYDGASKTATVSGLTADQATKEKIVLCCGNVHSVAKVDDQLTVAQGAAPAASMYEVKEGDTLTKIAKIVLGDANAYEKIFEANKPMPSDPNKIDPGQQLRIPQQA